MFLRNAAVKRIKWQDQGIHAEHEHVLYWHALRRCLADKPTARSHYYVSPVGRVQGRRSRHSSRGSGVLARILIPFPIF